MEIVEKDIKQITIYGADGLDPIRVMMDEVQKKTNTSETRYSGHIIILCYGVALNYYFESMGMPMRDFISNCETGYLLNKFEVNARETFRPEAYDCFIDENDELCKEESEASVEMATYHRDYICRLIEAVKKGFREQ